MPEDQGVNGDRWTEQASSLLNAFGWTKIADSNIDIEGADGLQHGIDALFKYKDGFKPIKDQGVFLEAKTYATSSFRPQKLNDWVSKIDNKIRELKLSQEFNERYPRISVSNAANGLLMIWFHDKDNYRGFLPTFKEAMLNVRTPRKRGSNLLPIRLFLLENNAILRLASLKEEIEKWENESSNQGSKINFYYPSSAKHGYAIQEIPVLNLEYFFSKFILAKAIEQTDQGSKTTDIVFYFGSLDIHSFFRLKQALLSYDMISSNNKLILYTYKREDSTFRKIRPDVEQLFRKEEGPLEFSIKQMTILGDLPPWMTSEG